MPTSGSCISAGERFGREFHPHLRVFCPVCTLYRDSIVRRSPTAIPELHRQTLDHHAAAYSNSIWLTPFGRMNVVPSCETSMIMDFYRITCFNLLHNHFCFKN